MDIRLKLKKLWLKGYSALPVVYGLNISEQRDKKIIVSLTSYPKRFQYLDLAIKSILRQTTKPDKVILYLGEDSEGSILSERLRKMEKYGLEIKYRKGNLRSHKKYVYALQEYPDDIVILIDDDMIYDRHLVERLMKSYTKYPYAVSASRVHRMAKNEDETLASYTHWEYEYHASTEPRDDLFSTTGFGTLLPPHSMDEQVVDADTSMKECFAADDVWLKYMQLRKGTPTVYVPGATWRGLPGTQETSLSSSNVDQDVNEEFIRRMERLTSIQLKDYCDLIYTKESTYDRLRP